MGKNKFECKVKEHHLKMPTTGYVEAGDLAREVGKFYMNDLMEMIDEKSALKKEALWFLCHAKKDIKDPNKSNISIGCLSQPVHFLREQFDLWKYDYRNEKLELIWTIPHRINFKTFLRAPEKYDPLLIRSIQQIVLQDNINLSDNKEVVVAA